MFSDDFESLQEMEMGIQVQEQLVEPLLQNPFSNLAWGQPDEPSIIPVHGSHAKMTVRFIKRVDSRHVGLSPKVLMSHNTKARQSATFHSQKIVDFRQKV
jgi:hypothetical protein